MPWQLCPGLYIYLSTRPQIRHDTVGFPLGCSKAESPATEEVGLYGYKSCTKYADTSYESMVGGRLASDRQSIKV